MPAVPLREQKVRRIKKPRLILGRGRGVYREKRGARDRVSVRLPRALRALAMTWRDQHGAGLGGDPNRICDDGCFSV